MVLQQVSLVERSSLSRRVPYRRFHCNNLCVCANASLFFLLDSQEKEGFETEIKMWVFEETVNGRKLTEIINETHCNEKYLPGFTIPENVV